MGRQGHKDAPLRLLSKAEIKEKVPILRMDDVSSMCPSILNMLKYRKRGEVEDVIVDSIVYKKNFFRYIYLV